MGLLDSVGISVSSRDLAGNWVFYPWGLQARGYEVPTKQDRIRADRFMFGLMALAIILNGTLQALLPFWYWLLACTLVVALALVLYAVWVRRTTSTWTVLVERNTLQKDKMLIVKMLFVFLVLFVLGDSAALLVALVTTDSEWPMHLAGLVMGAAASIVIYHILRSKNLRRGDMA